MPDAQRPRPFATQAATHPLGRRRTVLTAVLAVLVALLVPAIFTTTQAHADAHSPIGALDNVSITATGSVRVAGWVADPDAPTKLINISISDNGVAKLTVLANLARADVAAAQPGYGPNHGFDTTLNLIDGAHNVCVTGLNAGSGSNIQLGCQSVTLHNNPVATLSTTTVSGNTATATGTATDPNSLGAVLVQVYRDGKYAAGVLTDPSSHAYSLPVSVTEGSHSLCYYALNQGAGGNTSLGCRTVVVRNNPFGTVDTAGQTPTGVQVTGWAIDLNTMVALTVRAWVDGRFVTATTASVPHAGLAASYPTEGNNHGFAFSLNLAQGTHQVCVTADNVSYGASATIGCKSVTVQNNPIGALEHVVQVPGAIRLTGYAIDFNTTPGVVIHFYVDGKYAGITRASTPRLDVAARFPTAGPNHGFVVSLPATHGSHVVCATAVNVGAGASTAFPCRNVVIQNNPVGAINWSKTYPGGVFIAGWTIDPDTSKPLTIHVQVDGHFAAATVANANRPDLLTAYPYNGAGHGFGLSVRMPVGTHQVCVYALNAGYGTSLKMPCYTATRAVNPTGANSGISRIGYTDSVSFGGWTVDPDYLGPVTVRVEVDGVAKLSTAASAPSPASLSQFTLYGGNHGFSGSVNIGSGEHTVCVVLVNMYSGTSITLGCSQILSSGQTVPAPPTQASAWPGSREVTLSWAVPRSVNAPITRYLLTVNPGHRVVSLGGNLTTVVSHYLTNGVRYTFTLQGVNSYGLGSGISFSATPTNIPPQVTPAPVSTSHYVRNLTGNLSTDAAMMRSTGASDAAHNPSGHTYLVLLQIGGQDEADQGALLSATARFVTYPAVVSAMKAYLDGYATQQRPYAPMTLAIGTNNDVDVSTSAGISWARNIVNPVAAYAAAKHPGTLVAGANDMEPGFSASVGATRAWLSGYLSATSARFVFNGSADGCSTGSAGAGCNNGWHMSDLQWLAGGAAPSRTISLPQIYNYAMPLQWKYISLTGTNSGRTPINFGGPLTERTACAQAGGSCGSIANADAWNRLWAAISSSPATRQSQLPNGTDLRIN